MKKLSSGDPIVVYCGQRIRAEVLKVDGDFVQYRASSGLQSVCHRKQCRLIKKVPSKKKDPTRPDTAFLDRVAEHITWSCLTDQDKTRQAAALVELRGFERGLVTAIKLIGLRAQEETNVDYACGMSLADITLSERLDRLQRNAAYKKGMADLYDKK